MFKTSLKEIHTSQGRSVKITIVKQEEQRYEKQEAETQNSVRSDNQWILNAPEFILHTLIYSHYKRGGARPQISLTWYKEWTWMFWPSVQVEQIHFYTQNTNYPQPGSESLVCSHNFERAKMNSNSLSDLQSRGKRLTPVGPHTVSIFTCEY